jgi:glycosyltransferase involved in cell wall biosynthesis
VTESLVSVIVPVHAGERFINAALDSVAAQTYARVETIVVDDGSPDRAAEIAAERAGVSVLHQPRAGVAAARNAGAAAAHGELLAFLDQDDEWHPSKLELQVALLREHPEVSLVLAHMEVHLMAGTPRPSWFPTEWLREPHQPGYIPSTWLVRRDMFARIGPFDTTYETACDADWLARFKDAGLAGAMRLLPDVLVRWRIHDANGSYDQDTMRRERLRMMRGTATRQRDAARGRAGISRPEAPNAS